MVVPATLLFAWTSGQSALPWLLPGLALSPAIVLAGRWIIVVSDIKARLWIMQGFGVGAIFCVAAAIGSIFTLYIAYEWVAGLLALVEHPTGVVQQLLLPLGDLGGLDVELADHLGHAQLTFERFECDPCLEFWLVQSAFPSHWISLHDIRERRLPHPCLSSQRGPPLLTLLDGPGERYCCICSSNTSRSKADIQ